MSIRQNYPTRIWKKLEGLEEVTGTTQDWLNEFFYAIPLCTEKYSPFSFFFDRTEQYSPLSLWKWHFFSHCFYPCLLSNFVFHGLQATSKAFKRKAIILKKTKWADTSLGLWFVLCSPIHGHSSSGPLFLVTQKKKFYCCKNLLNNHKKKDF